MDVQAISKILTRKVGSVVSGGTQETDNSPKTDDSTKDPTQTDSTSSFAAFMSANLNPLADGTVSEEMLFKGIVKERLYKLKGDDGLKAFDKEFAVSSREYRSVEEATKYALMRMQESKAISYEEGHKLHAEAFAAAQLDSNKEALYDHTGGANDPTKAVMEIEKAIEKAKAAIEKFDAGTSKPLERPVAVSDTGIENINRGSSANYGQTTDGAVGGSATKVAISSTGQVITPNGSVVDGSGGFLFKPVSENERRLAVLSPDLVGPMVKSIKLIDKDGGVVEEGRFTSLGDDGRNRAKYAFRNEGAAYPKDLKVEIEYVDGQKQQYSIPDPSKRYD